jgi:hypothetical protein
MTYKDHPTTLLAKDKIDPPDLEANPEETTSLLTGYGAVNNDMNCVQTSFDASEDFPLEGEETIGAVDKRKQALKRCSWIGAGVLLYVAGVMAWNGSQRNGKALDAQGAIDNDVKLLGSSKKKTKVKEEKKKPKFEPVTYPSCPSGVDVTYIKQPLPFEMHEMAAQASDCELASIHNLEELEKYSKAGLFKMAYGPEIGMSFASGKPLTKTFWLGGRFAADSMGVGEWVDNSTWDFGPNTSAVEGCLASTFGFLEIAVPVIAPEDHWSVLDCATPLPAVYKCCKPTPAPSAYPTESPTDVPTDSPTDSPTDAPIAPPEDDVESVEASEQEEDIESEEADEGENEEEAVDETASESAEDESTNEAADETEGESGEGLAVGSADESAAEEKKPKKKKEEDTPEEPAPKEADDRGEASEPAEDNVYDSAVPDDKKPKKKKKKSTPEESAPEGSDSGEEAPELEDNSDDSAAEVEKPKKKKKKVIAEEEPTPEESDAGEDVAPAEEEPEPAEDDAGEDSAAPDKEKPKKK